VSLRASRRFALFLNQQKGKPSAMEIKARTLKIESTGDFFKGLVKPKIRISGRWLERAGFKAGGRVSIRCVAPGTIELQSLEAVTANDIEAIDRPIVQNH
jgi:hypothetical protein